jgi:DNA-binding MarR family transcriptional regulator
MSDEPIPTSRRPIGFWLRLLDRLIDEGLDATLATAHLTRRHWQVLNVLHDGPASIAEADQRVRPFLGADEPSTAPLVDQLVNDGWAVPTGARFELTATGASRYEHLLTEVSHYRRSIIAGITDEEYATTIDVLERMAVNLGWTS